jgi:hypothetical protein
MRFRTLLFSFLVSVPTLTHANETSRCSFGVEGNVLQTTVRLIESDDPGVWVYVFISNMLAESYHTGPCILHKENEEIRVFYLPFAGADPDLFRIEVPTGYYADPNEVIMDDNTTMLISIRFFTLS